jgi:integrase
MISDKAANSGQGGKRITLHVVGALRPPAKGNKIVWDSEVTGFGVRITAQGAIAFVLRYVIDGRERRYTIGKHPDLSPSAARSKAIVLRGEINEGRDPLKARGEARDAATVEQLCDDYIARHARPKKRLRSIEGDERLIRLYIKPELGNEKVSAVTRREIDELHQSLKDAPYQANRLLALLSKMFSLAISWGWRADNPVTGTERFQEQKRERWLSVDELGRLAKALTTHPDRRAANAILLLLLTGARRGEVLGATWDQFDLKRGVWTKPSHHTKQKKTEHVPLNADTLALLSDMRAKAIKCLGSENRLKEFPFLFPGDAEGKPLQEIKRPWANICKAAGIENTRVHDLRHTYASHLVSAGHSLPLVGRLLGHTQPGTTQRYAHLADDPLREATDQFGKIVKRAAKARPKRKPRQTAKVIPFRTARRRAV